MKSNQRDRCGTVPDCLTFFHRGQAAEADNEGHGPVCEGFDAGPGVADAASRCSVVVTMHVTQYQPVPCINPYCSANWEHKHSMHTCSMHLLMRANQQEAGLTMQLAPDGKVSSSCGEAHKEGAHGQVVVQAAT